MKNTSIIIALSLLVLSTTVSFANSAGVAQSNSADAAQSYSAGAAQSNSAGLAQSRAGFVNSQEPKLQSIGRKFRKEVADTVIFKGHA